MKITERQLRKVIRQIISEDVAIKNDQNLINEGHTKKAIEAALLAAGIAFSGSQLVNFVNNLQDNTTISSQISHYDGTNLRAAHSDGVLGSYIDDMNNSDLMAAVNNFVPKQGNTGTPMSRDGEEIQNALKDAAIKRGIFNKAQMYSMD